MKIQFLGTAAGEGVPAVFCECEYCSNIRRMGENEFRTRSQVIIDDSISVDFPSDAYYHSLKFGVKLSKIKHVLVTHSHLDHFYAHDFVLRGYKYAKFDNCKLNIYGNKEVGDVYSECVRREMKSVVGENIVFNVIKPYDCFEFDGYKILALPANHVKTEEALLFYIEHNGKGYLHCYDTALLGDEVFVFLKANAAKIDAACFDCTFVDKSGGVGARHMGIEEDMLMKNKLEEYGLLAEDAKIIISHFSHNGNPIKEKLKILEKKYSVIAAYDGYILEV